MGSRHNIGGGAEFKSYHHPDPRGLGDADHRRDSRGYCYQPQVQRESKKERYVSHNRPPDVKELVGRTEI